MANATRGLKRISRNKYVVRFADEAVGLISKKGQKYEAMRFGAYPRRTTHSKLSDAFGTLLAERVNASIS